MANLLPMKSKMFKPEDLALLYKSNPMFAMQDQILCWWYDQWMTGVLKMYYWPAFVAGSADNVVDLFKPQTYNICRA